MTTHGHLLSQFTTVSFSEVVAASGLSAEEFGELVELGGCAPCRQEGSDVYFPASAIEAARMARRLRSDFEMSIAGVALLLSRAHTRAGGTIARARMLPALKNEGLSTKPVRPAANRRD